uniref:Heat shock protein beta-1 n=1 Tax=Lepeophtheirus salmonis TaxID=72036 RepID=C1BVY5_LEPSM|nr:Heat shock protein beta-1 [Lepeophtheirus salmonis]
MMQRSLKMMNSFQDEMKKMEQNMLSNSSSGQSYSVKQSSSSSSSDIQKDSMNKNNNQTLSSETFDTALSPLGRTLNPFFFSRGWPSLFDEDLNKSLNIFQDKDEQVIRVKDNEDKFEISLDTHQYRPDEVKVNIKNGVICIEAKHEEKSSDGCNFVSRQFLRSYTLPKNSKAESVSSNLSSDGILAITAPKIKQAFIEGQRSIPISMKK